MRRSILDKKNAKTYTKIVVIYDSSLSYVSIYMAIGTLFAGELARKATLMRTADCLQTKQNLQELIQYFIVRIF